jgi:hypothetical protein
LRISKEYRFESSQAATKLKGSRGFQLVALGRARRTMRLSWLA